MEVIVGSAVVFAIVVLAMSVGQIFGGRSLRGSCGGVANGDCACSEKERRACARRDAA